MGQRCENTYKEERGRVIEEWDFVKEEKGVNRKPNFNPLLIAGVDANGNGIYNNLVIPCFPYQTDSSILVHLKS